MKKVTPTGSTGRIFGFVYSGLDFGSSLMPLLLGLIMDIGSANYVFYACAVMLFLTIFTVANVKNGHQLLFSLLANTFSELVVICFNSYFYADEYFVQLRPFPFAVHVVVSQPLSLLPHP